MPKKDLFSIHIIRVFAIMMVVLLHVSAPVRDQWHNMATANFIVGSIFDSFGRSGVPLFLMISGALLLGRQEEPLAFYRKRFSRIILPFLFWGLLYVFFNAWQNKQTVYIGKIVGDILWGPSYYHLSHCSIYSSACETSFQKAFGNIAFSMGHFQVIASSN